MLFLLWYLRHKNLLFAINYLNKALLCALFFCVLLRPIMAVAAASISGDITFSNAQVNIIKGLTLSAHQIKSRQLNADPSNQFSQNIHAKKLGKMLFFDERLSASHKKSENNALFIKNQKISCASCHNFSLSLADKKTTAHGMGIGERNTPTLINSFMQRWFFWDGRADSLWMQALGPIESPLEMTGDWPTIYTAFINDPVLFNGYNTAFKPYKIKKNTAYSHIDSTRFKVNIAKALAAFQLDIVQFNSRFDAFAQSLITKSAINTPPPILSQQEKKGLALFIGKARCILCHSGPNFSDGQFHNIRLNSQLKNPKDSGRFGAIKHLKNSPFNILGQYSDLPKNAVNARAKTQFLTLPAGAHNNLWAAYKTPTLRNINQTAPYMHDGSFRNLEAVITHYSTFSQAAPNSHALTTGLLQPLNLSPAEQGQLLAFLQTLTGTVNIPAYP